MKKPSVNSVILASLVAAVLAAVQPFVVSLNLMICIAPIFIALLYAWGGMIPAGILSIGTVGSLAWFAGMSGAVSPVLGALGALIALVAPGIIAIELMKRQLPFFRRMQIAAAVQVVTLLGCVAFVYLGMKVDLADALTGMLRESMVHLPQDMLEPMLQYFAVSGMMTRESIEELTTGIVLYSDVQKVLEQVFDQMNYVLKQTLPAMLLTGGMISGILTTALPGAICARRGDDVPHVPLHQWFLPSHLVGGLVICLISSFVMQYMRLDEALAVTQVFSLLSSSLFIIQGMAAINRRFRAVGAGRGMRTGVMVAGVVFAPNFVELYGIMSALFGRRGAISSFMRRRMEEMDNNRKDDE